MTDPWAVTPFPPHGDERPDDTYKMVGHALSNWETLEYQLAHLYAAFVGQTNKIAALREYGNGNIFTLRLRALKSAAEPFFTVAPNQQAEGEFDRIALFAERLADRRNEIAHGIVRPLQWVQQVMLEYLAIRGQALEYALVPALYTRKKLDEKHRPKYIYTANELMQFSVAFFDLSQEALSLKQQIADAQRA